MNCGSKILSSARLVASCLALHTPAWGAIKAEPIPDLKPPHGALTTSEFETARWPWLVVGACLAAAAALLWPRKQPVHPAELPHAAAVRELRALRPLEPRAIGQILRAYLVATHPAPGPGQTFEDLATLLAAEPRWTPELRERFRRLADPIEIANFSPSATPLDLERLREQALALITDAEALRTPPVSSVP